jgi:hypothetical protein
MKRLWALMVLAAIVFGVSLPSSNAAQKRGRTASATRNARAAQLGSVAQFKEAFQYEAGKVRLVALVSPT